MKKLMCALAMIAASAPAFAEPHRHHRANAVDERQHRLEQRIEEGRRSGQLTRHEYGRLHHELSLIAREERAFRSDGYFSQRESQHLHARLDALAQKVAYEKRDSDRRGPHYGGPYYNDYRAAGRF